MPTPAPNAYPLDPTGLAPTNLVSNEERTITATNGSNYHILLPLFGPFFEEGAIISHRAPNTAGFTPLAVGVDYNFCYPYVGVGIRTGKSVWGGISFINLQLAGTIRLTYQSLGGEYTLDLPTITELTANIVYNPRITTWEQISGAPAHFPPHAHAWDPGDLTNMTQFYGLIEEIRDAILNPNVAGLISHMTDQGNPHRVTKKQVGLEFVQNYGVATIAEAIAGIATNKYITPAALRAAMQMIDSRQYASIQEAITLTPVPKIVTMETLVELLKTHGIIGNIDPIVSVTTKPTIITPMDTGIYTGGNYMRCLAFTGTNTGAVIKTQSITGVGSLVIPIGVNQLKITGRGAVGTTTAQGGQLNAGNPILSPGAFEADATLSMITPTISGTEGAITVRVVAPAYNGLDLTITLNLTNSTSTQRVYSNSIPIGTNPLTGSIEYGTITIIYTGTAPSVVNIPGANATVTVLGTQHVFEGSPNADTLPTNKSDEVVLNINNSTTVTYTVGAGADINLSWFEPSSSTSKIQIDTEWEISNARTFASGNIIDSTALGKGENFSLTQWRPSRDAMATNNIYWVRSRWKFNNQTTSDWSDIVEFNFQATNVFPPEGQIVGYFCRNQDQWANVADGLGGTRERINQTNSTACGYQAGGGTTPIGVIVASTPSVTLNKSEFVLVQNGGTHPYQLAVSINATIEGFVQNIEDDRIRLYLKDSFYSQYLTHKANQGQVNAAMFRVPYKVVGNSLNQDIKIELLNNGLNPPAMGTSSNAPTQYQIKISLNSNGYNTLYSADVNKTDIVIGLDTANVFKDETGSNFVAQSLTATTQKSLTATITSKTLVQYRPA